MCEFGKSKLIQATVLAHPSLVELLLFSICEIHTLEMLVLLYFDD
jgi:hypothetical protein